MTEFAVFIGAGATLGLLWVAQVSKPKQAMQHIDAGLLVLLGSLVGGRLGYVLVRVPYYQGHPVEILEVWKGGLSLGAVPGAICALLLAALIWRTSILDLTDALSPLILPLAVAAWLGCWQVGCAYGETLPQGSWWGILARDESGIVALRQPLQLLAAFCLLVYFGWLELSLPSLKAQGRFGSLACLGLGLDLLVFCQLRADAAPYWLGLRAELWAALLLCLFSLVLGLFSFLHRSASRERT